MKARETKKQPNGDAGAPVVKAEQQLPEGDEAAKAIRELADLNEEVRRMQTQADAAHDDYKAAKDALAASQKALSDRLYALTHKPNLPLFNEAQAEADLERIQAQAESGETGVADEAQPPTALDGGEKAASVPAMTLGEAGVPSDTPADSEPF